MSPSRGTLVHLATLAAIRIAVSALVLRLGFSALSDDDYARVTIAQSFAASPQLDPSGTSWLPFPFWLNGAVMAGFGASLGVARAAAVVLGVLASCGLYLAYRASGSSSRGSFAAAVGSTLMPVSALTGVATVPELATAALGASALVMLRRPTRSSLLLAAACVLPASLSRYEAWPVAIVVALGALIEPRRRGLPAVSRPVRAAAALVSLSGIAAWLVWNRVAHGDMLHFHARVSSFWFASGHSHGQAVAELLRGYPWTSLAGVPALTTLVLGALWIAYDREAVASWRRPLGGAALVVAALTAMQATGGAPTHHPERTLMLVWMVAWAFAADLWDRSAWAKRVPYGVAAGAAIVVALLGKQTIDQARGGQADRSAEVRVGRWLRANAAGSTVLVDPADYGYFAIMAAYGTPGRVVLSHSIDPRDAPSCSPFEDEGRLRARVQETRAAWLVARADRATAARAIGRVAAEDAGWVVVRVMQP